MVNKINLYNHSRQHFHTNVTKSKNSIVTIELEGTEFLLIEQKSQDKNRHRSSNTCK